MKTLGELLVKDGAAVLGNPATACPHCGRAARPYEVVTPLKGWRLTFWIPPVNCCARNRRTA